MCYREEGGGVVDAMELWQINDQLSFVRLNMFLLF